MTCNDIVNTLKEVDASSSDNSLDELIPRRKANREEMESVEDMDDAPSVR